MKKIIMISLVVLFANSAGAMCFRPTGYRLRLHVLHQYGDVHASLINQRFCLKDPQSRKKLNELYSQLVVAPPYEIQDIQSAIKSDCKNLHAQVKTLEKIHAFAHALTQLNETKGLGREKLLNAKWIAVRNWFEELLREEDSNDKENV